MKKILNSEWNHQIYRLLSLLMITTPKRTFVGLFNAGIKLGWFSLNGIFTLILILIVHSSTQQICRALFREFFTGCSIQGVKYFCERKRHWSERYNSSVLFTFSSTVQFLWHSKMLNQTPFRFPLVFRSQRVFWMVMFVIAVCLSCRMIHESYTKWDQTPVIISLSTKATPVWKIPFPAVTICPEVKTSSQKINLTDIFRQRMRFVDMPNGT